MTFDEMIQGISEARRTIEKADTFVEGMVSLCVGRLHKMPLNYRSVQDLAKLKRELRDFNVTTGRWKK